MWKWAEGSLPTKDFVMKIVVASDSFKDSLTSGEVASAVSEGILRVEPEAEVVCLAVGDGGEGTSEVLTDSLGGSREECEVRDPLGRLIRARYGVADVDGLKTAFIEMAASGGLQLLTEEERDVMRTSSVGLGEMILDAYSKGCRRFVVGIGGSATCDVGMGMLSTLGFRFLNSAGDPLSPIGASLGEVEEIDVSEGRRDITGCRFIVVCDVSNPLSGASGAACVYAPQKGATPDEVLELDRGLSHFSRVLAQTLGRDVAGIPGAGAAGGIGSAFLGFFNSELKPGVDAVLDLIGFDSAVEGAELVITGEGRIDRQTLFGKLPLGICRRAKMAGVPLVVAVAGAVEDVPELLEAGFDGIFPILNRPMYLHEALRPETARKNLRTLGASIARLVRKSIDK